MQNERSMQKIIKKYTGKWKIYEVNQNLALFFLHAVSCCFCCDVIEIRAKQGIRARYFGGLFFICSSIMALTIDVRVVFFSNASRFNSRCVFAGTFTKTIDLSGFSCFLVIFHTLSCELMLHVVTSKKPEKTKFLSRVG